MALTEFTRSRTAGLARGISRSSVNQQQALAEAQLTGSYASLTRMTGKHRACAKEALLLGKHQERPTIDSLNAE